MQSEKVRGKTWATSLGKALDVSGKVVCAVEGFLPGANIIGGALSYGATLLNPELSVEDSGENQQITRHNLVRFPALYEVRPKLRFLSFV